MKRFGLVATLLIAMLPQLLIAADGDVLARGEQRLTAFINSTIAWQADFEQQATDPSGRQLDTATGTFMLLRPGRFRWEYITPWVQTVVADGERLWMYDVDLEQVTVRSQAGILSSTPAALLAGDTSALEQFVITDVAEQGDELWVQLAPEDNSGDFEQIRIGFNGNALAGLQLTDKLAQTTTILFTNVRPKPELSAADFVLNLPDSVDIIDESQF